MTADDPQHPEVRRLLDALPAPAVRPVDLHELYAAAARHQARAAKRWRRLAAAAIAAAAGVLILALLPRLEVRAGGGEFAVRWGGPAAADVRPAAEDPADRLAARLAVLEAEGRRADAALARLADRTKQVEELAAAQQELKDLLLVVAADVDRLDGSQKAAADQQRRLSAWLSARLRDVDGRLAEVRKDNTAIYTLVTDARKGTVKE